MHLNALLTGVVQHKNVEKCVIKHCQGAHTAAKLQLTEVLAFQALIAKAAGQLNIYWLIYWLICGKNLTASCANMCLRNSLENTHCRSTMRTRVSVAAIVCAAAATTSAAGALHLYYSQRQIQ
jgi:hypothetical protein